ncbi:MAG: GNAT family N-acetyltransferase, partial [Candidatus Methanoplasma sp.]|nr:GNAT family N-acetyltransferase [Candidatus Methanoplasma sp.]
NEKELNELQDFSEEYLILDNENLFIYAAQSEDKFVGYVSIVYIPKVGRKCNGHLFIDELWVNPHYRKRGIADALMKKADILCKEKNISGLRLYVDITNNDALSLYKKCGYEGKFGTSQFMEKELSN